MDDHMHLVDILERADWIVFLRVYFYSVISTVSLSVITTNLCVITKFVHVKHGVRGKKFS